MQMKTIAQHQPPDVQPVPEQWPPCPPPPSFIAEHDVVWCGTSLRSARVSCPSCVPSSFLCTLVSNWRGGGGGSGGTWEENSRGRETGMGCVSAEIIWGTKRQVEGDGTGRQTWMGGDRWSGE